MVRGDLTQVVSNGSGCLCLFASELEGRRGEVPSSECRACRLPLITRRQQRRGGQANGPDSVDSARTDGLEWADVRHTVGRPM